MNGEVDESQESNSDESDDDLEEEVNDIMNDVFGGYDRTYASGEEANINVNTSDDNMDIDLNYMLITFYFLLSLYT